MGDAAGSAIADQKLPDGNYHLDRMLGAAARPWRGHRLLQHLPDARGVTDDMPIKGTRRSTLDELADWTLWADQVITF